MKTPMEKILPGGSARANGQRVTRKTNYIPWIIAIIFGVLWSAAYVLLGRMHGMWPMFNSEFPFSTAHLFTSRVAELSVGVGALFAFIDGAVAGLAGSWILLLTARITSGIGR